MVQRIVFIALARFVAVAAWQAEQGLDDIPAESALALIQTSASGSSKGNISVTDHRVSGNKSSASILEDTNKQIQQHTEAKKTQVDMASTMKQIKLQASGTSNEKSGHEIEMPLGQEPQLVKSKVALAVISGFGLGCCGIDRCYMGATCLGITKGLTLGGLGIWAFVDFLVILINMLQKADSINALGFQATFEPESEIKTAFWITVILLMFKLLGGACTPKSGASKL